MRPTFVSKTTRMSFNKQYNTRHTNRYNTPGQFVSAGEHSSLSSTNYNAPRKITPNQNQNHNQNVNLTPVIPQSLNQNQPKPQVSQNMEVDMKPSVSNDGDAASAAGSEGTRRPFWMKSKLQGIKKLSNKERRRRQNENLRRLLTPKNALMVLNEMLPNEQLANQFKVEPAVTGSNQYYNSKTCPNFCADLTIKGHTYKGYGENKLTARNIAAEQAIRDLIIQKMNKACGIEADSKSGVGSEGEEGEEESLPMIQLASFALHKLFAEWEYEGHKVPQLRPSGHSVSEEGDAAAPRAPIRARALPANAACMHPCMLLTYMRPHVDYRELAVDGDRPQNLMFTIGLDVDGATYIGKAPNKKEARKQAARAACEALFGVSFGENPVENAPVPV